MKMTRYGQNLSGALHGVFRHAGSSVLSAFLVTALFAALAWLFLIWKEPLVALPRAEGAFGQKPVRASVNKAAAKSEAYRASSERDIFRPVLPRAVERPKKAKKTEPLPPPPPPVKPPPPRLALIGTIILDDREAAIIDYAGSGQKGTYRVGDDIEGFVIKEIRKDWVLLDRDGEAMRVFMSQSSGAGGGPTGRGHSPAPQGSDIPAALIPRPKAPSYKTP